MASRFIVIRSVALVASMVFLGFLTPSASAQTICLTEKNADCPVESGKVPCPDNQCVFEREETVYERDEDGEIISMEVVKYYICDTQIGYYEVKGSYKTVEETPASLLDMKKGFKNTVDTDFFCWKKAGCPVRGCVETWDANDPGKKVWYCAAPAQTPQNDPASKVQQRVGDSNFPCP